jgi:hypothetical protein
VGHCGEFTAVIRLVPFTGQLGHFRYVTACYASKSQFLQNGERCVRGVVIDHLSRSCFIAPFQMLVNAGNQLYLEVSRARSFVFAPSDELSASDSYSTGC